MSESMVSAAQFDDVLQRVEDGLKQVEEAADALIQDVNAFMQWLGPFANQVKDLLAEFADGVMKFLSEVGHCLTGVGQPWVLGSAGTTWTTEVGHRASSLVGVIDAAQLSVQRHWTGAASQAYAAEIPQQSKALAAVKASTDELHDILVKVEWAIYAFWAALAVISITLAVEIFGEGAAASTGVGAPPAAAAAGISVAKALGLLAATTATATGLLTAFNIASADLKQRLENEDAFPLGHWPRAAADFSASGAWKPISS